MPEKTRDRRAAPVSYRPPEALREEFAARVKRSGLTTNAFLTQAWYGKDPPRQTRRPPVEKEMLARLLAEAARVNDRLHEVAGAGKGDPALMEEACRDLTELRTALLTLMGRKP